METFAPGRLVVFDTSTVAKKYLVPLLKGERLRVVSQLRGHTPPYIPAIHERTLHELLQRAKLGTGHFPWMSRSHGYPGGLSRWKVAHERLDESAMFRFAQAEEQVATDWNEREEFAQRFTADPDAAADQVRDDRRFAEWYAELQGFMRRVDRLVSNEFVVIHPWDVYGRDGQRFQAASEITSRLQFSALVPSEDLEMVVAACMLDAAAIVTGDKGLIAQSVALGLESRPALVHESRIEEALAADFGWLWWPPAT